jgi:hypothetical protein
MDLIHWIKIQRPGSNPLGSPVWISLTRVLTRSGPSDGDPTAPVPCERGRWRGAAGGGVDTAARRRRTAARRRNRAGVLQMTPDSTRMTVSARRTPRRASGVATARRGGARRSTAAAQVRQARERAEKRGITRKTHQRAPHLHLRLPECFAAAGKRRRSGIDAAAG